MNGENYLEAMETVLYALTNMYANKSNPVPKSRIDDIITSCVNIQQLLDDKCKGYVSNCINDVVAALTTAKEISGTNIPDRIKQEVIDGLHDIKTNIANICFEFYTYEDIDTESEIIVNIMREVVKAYLEGSVIDD